MFEGLKDWSDYLRRMSRTFRNLWGWTDKDVDCLSFDRSFEIHEEAKQNYPDYFKETE